MMRSFLSVSFLLFVAFALQAESNASTLKIGDKAPDFTITDPNGKTLHLSSLRGKVVLVDFWASWCVPCRETNPELIGVYNAYQSYGFEIFSISLDHQKDKWINAIKADKLPWLYHGCEMKGWDSPIAAQYGVEGIPSTFLINEQGVIIEMDLDEYDLERKLHFIYHEQVNAYPHNASTKLYFTSEAKFQIEDKAGKVLSKGKATEADLTGMTPGEYIVRIEGRAEKFNKVAGHATEVTFYPTRVDDVITLSSEADYEIYNARGTLELKGKGNSVNVLSLKTGSYHISIYGNVSSFYKK